MVPHRIACPLRSSGVRGDALAVIITSAPAYKTDRERIHALVTYTVLASLNGCAGRKRSHSEVRTFPRSLLLPYSVYLDSLLASPCSGFAFATQFSCPGSPFSQNRSWSFGFRVYREPDSVTLGVVTELQHAFPSGEQRTGLWVTGVTPFTMSPQGQLT